MYTLGIATDGYLHEGLEVALALAVNGYLDDGTIIDIAPKTVVPELKGIPRQRKRKDPTKDILSDEDDQILAILHSFIQCQIVN